MLYREIVLDDAQIAFEDGVSGLPYSGPDLGELEDFVFFEGQIFADDILVRAFVDIPPVIEGFLLVVVDFETEEFLVFDGKIIQIFDFPPDEPLSNLSALDILIDSF